MKLCIHLDTTGIDRTDGQTDRSGKTILHSVCHLLFSTRQNAEQSGSADQIAIGQFYHVTDPHFVTFSNSLYTIIRNPNPNLTLILTLTLACNATVITDLQIGPIDPQIVIVLIRPEDPLRSAFCRVPICYAC